MSENVAEERLRHAFRNWLPNQPLLQRSGNLNLDEALATARSEGYEYGLLHNEAAEVVAAVLVGKNVGRKEAVERIKAHIPENGKWYGLKTVWAILDEEAAR